MKRGDVFRVAKPLAADPKRFRAFVVVSRQTLIESRFSTVVCAPVYTTRYGLSTEVAIGVEEGLRHDSGIHCDALVSVPKAVLTHFVGHLSPAQLLELDRALVAALDVDVEAIRDSAPR